MKSTMKAVQTVQAPMGQCWRLARAQPHGAILVDVRHPNLDKLSNAHSRIPYGYLPAGWDR